MEAKTNKICRQYLRKVRRALSCSWTMKALAMKDLQERVAEYVGGYKGKVTVEHLEECFGTAAEVGESFFSKNDLAVLKKRANRTILWMIVAVAALICLAFVTYLVIYLMNSRTFITAYSGVYK